MVSGDIRVEVWVTVDRNNIQNRAEDLIVLLNDVKRLRSGDWSLVSIFPEFVLDLGDVIGKLLGLAETLEDSLITSNEHGNVFPLFPLQNAVQVLISAAGTITDEDTKDDLNLVSPTGRDDGVKGITVRRVEADVLESSARNSLNIGSNLILGLAGLVIVVWRVGDSPRWTGVTVWELNSWGSGRLWGLDSWSSGCLDNWSIGGGDFNWVFLSWVRVGGLFWGGVLLSWVRVLLGWVRVRGFLWDWDKGLGDVDMLIGGADVDLVGFCDGDDLLMAGVDTWLVRCDSWILTWNHVRLGDGGGKRCDGVCTWGWADIGGHHNLGGNSRAISLGDGYRASDNGLGINDGSNTTDSMSSRRQSSRLLTAKVLSAGQGHGLLRDGVNSWSRTGGDLWGWDVSMWDLNHGWGWVLNRGGGGGHLIVVFVNNGYELLAS